jgi:hypothetical protein
MPGNTCSHSFIPALWVSLWCQAVSQAPGTMVTRHQAHHPHKPSGDRAVQGATGPASTLDLGWVHQRWLPGGGGSRVGSGMSWRSVRWA